MSILLDRKTAEAFAPLRRPARYKGAHGGRGSGKSHFFAENMVFEALKKPGFRAVCIREVQKSLAQSAKKLIEDKIDQHGLARFGFRVMNDRIETPGGGVVLFQGMQDHTAESIKSLENFSVAWVEEAQTLSEISLKLLRPTIRAEGSEIWFSWNPRHKNDPVDNLLRQGETPSDSAVVKVNWDSNPWFPAVLEMERQDCLRTDPDQYDHIWEGGYITVAAGAYYAKHLAEAKSEGRICTVPIDPLLPVRLYADIGGTGSKSDAFVFWAAQFVGKEIRVLDHYESQGQDLGTHLAWLRERGYHSNRANIYLPHDGATSDKVYSVSYESAFKAAGYNVTVIPNQGKGAAKQRIEATRRRFPAIWFNAETTEGGRDALGWYHEKKDETRQIGLGPEHDWASHAADAFGLMCVAYEEPTVKRSVKKVPKVAVA